MTLLCVVCLYKGGLKPGPDIPATSTASPADTVIEGYAVCEDHFDYVAQGERFSLIIRAAREEK